MEHNFNQKKNATILFYPWFFWLHETKFYEKVSHQPARTITNRQRCMSPVSSFVVVVAHSFALHRREYRHYRLNCKRRIASFRVCNDEKCLLISWKQMTNWFHCSLWEVKEKRDAGFSSASFEFILTWRFRFFPPALISESAFVFVLRIYYQYQEPQRKRTE